MARRSLAAILCRRGLLGSRNARRRARPRQRARSDLTKGASFMDAQRLRRSSLIFSLVLVGIGAAVLAAGSAYIGLHLAAPMQSADSWLFYLSAPVAALVIGPLFCWLFLLRPNRLTLRRGIVVGLLGSVVAHPLT